MARAVCRIFFGLGLNPTLSELGSPSKAKITFGCVKFYLKRSFALAEARAVSGSIKRPI
jgi:hypothetical protein